LGLFERPRASAVEQALAAMDLDELSARQAIDRLYHLKSLLP
jgi:hypothetical protein